MYMTIMQCGHTTLAACCSKPTNDKMSYYVALAFGMQTATKYHIQPNLSIGKRASILAVSIDNAQEFI